MLSVSRSLIQALFMTLVFGFWQWSVECRGTVWNDMYKENGLLLGSSSQLQCLPTARAADGSEVILNKCPELLGTKCLPIISRLGPQLTHLALDRVGGIMDEDMLHVWKHCTNLRGLSLKETRITDILLTAMTESIASSGSSAWTTESTTAARLPLTHLNVVGTGVSDEGLVSVIRASRDTLSSISAYATEFAYEFLFAFVEDSPTTEIQVGLSELHLEMSELKLKEQTDCRPTKRTFTPNTVLTSISFTGLSAVVDGGFDELFQYATELSSIRLEGCGLSDEPLLILAENYRKRMEVQRLGVSQAWYNHDIGNKRFERSQKKGRRKGNPPVTPPPKFYTSGKVVGGLKVLWLKDCPEIGNRGVRAIVRSCVGLERLGLIGESYVSLRVFRGPWACLNLVDLDISGMNVRFKEPIELMDEEIFEEELCEIVRFPISPVKNFNRRLDFDYHGTYDFISRPSYEFEDDGVWEEDFGEGDLEEEDSRVEDFIEDAEYLFDSDDDDDLYDIDFGDEVGRHVRFKFPPLGLRNQTAHRTTLREFYKRLGQLSHLRKLNMSNSDYRIRIHDGLHFVLPSLRNSLEEWNITRYSEYQFHNHELAWIGRNFGYVIGFPDYEEGPEYLNMMVAQSDGDGDPEKHRIGKLRSLTVSDYTTGCLTTDVIAWFEDQGIALCYQDEDDSDAESEGCRMCVGTAMGTAMVTEIGSVDHPTGAEESHAVRVTSLFSLLPFTMAKKKKSSKKRSSKGTTTHGSILPPQQETSSHSTTTPSEAPAKTTTLTRFAIPEILSRIILFLELKDIFSASQVSCIFHNVCAPELWKVIRLDGRKADYFRNDHKGFRMGLIRNGHFVKELRLTHTSIEVDGMKIIAENCTRLRVLDLTGTSISLEVLEVLLHSDPYDTSPETAKKSKQQRHSGGNGGGDVGGDEEDIDVESGIEGRMWKYREMAAAANNGNSVPYSSTGSVSPSLFRPGGVSAPRACDTKVRGNPKAAREQFPYFLEVLILNKCPELLGTTCLPIISRLGPQLTHLALDCVKKVKDEDMLHVWRHCINLRGLSLNETWISDILLVAMTESMNASPGPSTAHNSTTPGFSSASTVQRVSRLPLTYLDVLDTDVSDMGLVSMIRASRDTLTSITTHTGELAYKVIFALVEEPLTAEVQVDQFDLDLEEEADHGPIKRTFITNTVLTFINFTGLPGEFEGAFEQLFRYATELSTICLEACLLSDESLLILAENYRKRMERQGLGVPNAWYQHELGNKRFEGSEKQDQLKGKGPLTPPPRFYAGGKVVGGLKVLWLQDCYEVGNKGIRAIVRSCIGLERLGLIGYSWVSLRVFRGPWACLDLEDLDISELSVRFKVPIESLGEEIIDEELCETERFPITPVKDFNTKLDFDKDGTYDFISKPSREDTNQYWDNESELEEGYEYENLIEDISLDVDTGASDGRPSRLKYPPPGRRNQTAHRTTLREFYRKLGQLKHLRKLNMSDSDYRIRLHDGLHLALPGLRNSLEEWNITRYPEYRLHHHELAWIGKHFGYGFKYPNSEEGLEHQRMAIWKFKTDQNPDKYRLGKLKTLV
ncbi:MAG: hypothetical protein J3Q66DRAFT_422661 [Benniella sp.]|nr:MAG: hypothetical protein J3Q66DRAFT_422661 [Benniella sp.]